MRLLCRIVLFFTAGTCFGQQQMAATVRSGLNRIGVFYEVGVQETINRYELEVGLRWYEPDLVFEKELPGINIACQFGLRPSKKTVVILGVSSGIFFEKKQNTGLLLFDPKLRLGPKWQIGKRTHISTLIGLGMAINRTKTTYAQSAAYFNYLNYELSVGIAYRFWGAGRD